MRFRPSPRSVPPTAGRTGHHLAVAVRCGVFASAGLSVLGLVVISLVATGSARAAALDDASAKAIVDASDRTEADRKKDIRRHPADLLVFAGVGPGMKVADIGAGDGYTTELLARAVGPSGVVISHNTPYVFEKFASESWPARLGKPVNAGVVRVVNGYAAPLPSGTRDLDVIALVYVYHDLYLSKLGEFDHQSMLRSLLAALKPGGRVIVVDHMAKGGMRGPSVADDLHRIDAALVKEDFEMAGFEFDGSAAFMRNREDPRTEPFFRMTEPTDSLVYRFVKPK